MRRLVSYTSRVSDESSANSGVFRSVVGDPGEQCYTIDEAHSSQEIRKSEEQLKVLTSSVMTFATRHS
ncbi:hypothetical protein CHUAL_009135, partial [Chamberlinius hualienensis]